MAILKKTGFEKYFNLKIKFKNQNYLKIIWESQNNAKKKKNPW